MSGHDSSLSAKTGYSALILTLNEERNMPACIASLVGCDDIVILDSGSTDRTCEIARAAGARVFERKFDNFAGQRNHGDRNIEFKHRWVFHLDADERMTPELALECTGVAAKSDDSVTGYFAAPKMLWKGRWLRRCTDFPAYQARFVRVPSLNLSKWATDSASIRRQRWADWTTATCTRCALMASKAGWPNIANTPHRKRAYTWRGRRQRQGHVSQISSGATP